MRIRAFGLVRACLKARLGCWPCAWAPFFTAGPTFCVPARPGPIAQCPWPVRGRARGTLAGMGGYANAGLGLPASGARPDRSLSQIIQGQFPWWYISSSRARSFTVSAGDQYPLYG